MLWDSSGRSGMVVVRLWAAWQSRRLPGVTPGRLTRAAAASADNVFLTQATEFSQTITSILDS